MAGGNGDGGGNGSGDGDGGGDGGGGDGDGGGDGGGGDGDGGAGVAELGATSPVAWVVTSGTLLNFSKITMLPLSMSVP